MKCNQCQEKDALMLVHMLDGPSVGYCENCHPGPTGETPAAAEGEMGEAYRNLQRALARYEESRAREPPRSTKRRMEA